MNLHNRREIYDKYHLVEDQVPNSPFKLFEAWFQQAELDKNVEPNAMILSTSVNNMPNSRVVLLKSIENEAFGFFTNYNSQKGKELETNPNVMLLFFWNMSQRQVRIKGIISKMERKESEDYFYSRPIESQWSAIASPQSQRITLEELKLRVEKVESEKISCPINWGGYWVHPTEFEFWQGQPGRLHDRLIYEKKSDNQWEIYRLAP